MLIPNRFDSLHDYRFGFNGMENDREIKGEGNSYDFGARMLDPRVGRWFAQDPLQIFYSNASPYNFVLNSPIQAIDPDGKRVYFIAGAGDDAIGWNYMERFRKIWTGDKVGIKDFRRVRASHHKPESLKDGIPVKDILFTKNWRHNNVIGLPRGGLIKATDNKKIMGTANTIINDLIKNPLKEGEQLNLTGYSFGSVL